MKMSNDAKTGLLVLICIVALGALVIKVSNFKLFKTGYTVKSHFHFTGGVKKHAPVRLSGVDVGEVKEIRLLYGDETLIEVVLWFNEGVKLRTDSKAYVTTLGMMGEKYIEIKPGTPATEWAQEGSIIPSQDPIRLEDILAMAKQVGADVSRMTNEISTLARHIDETVVGAKPNINNIFENLEETSENFREFSEDIKYHPWKILAKGKEKSKEERAHDRAEAKAKKAAAPTLEQAPPEPLAAPAPRRQNFGRGH